MCSRSPEYGWAGGLLIFRSGPPARRAKAERSGSHGGGPKGRQPLWSRPLLAGVEIPRLNGSLVALCPWRHGRHGKPDGVCGLGGPLLFAPVAKVQGAVGGVAWCEFS